jgi:hypothetical protein
MAIRAEADIIAADAGADLLESTDQAKPRVALPLHRHVLNRAGQTR